VLATAAAGVLARQIDGLRWLRLVSPFDYASDNEPLRGGLRLGDVAVLALVTAVFLAVTAVAFDRRDIAA
jgi:ABC-2 type transport system permease protein